MLTSCDERSPLPLSSSVVATDYLLEDLSSRSSCCVQVITCAHVFQNTCPYCAVNRFPYRVNRCTSLVQSSLCICVQRVRTCVREFMYVYSMCVRCLHCRSRRVESERAAHCSRDARRGRRCVHRVRAFWLRAAELPASHLCVPPRRLSSGPLRCVFTFSHKQTHTFSYSIILVRVYGTNTTLRVCSPATDMLFAQSAIWFSPTRARC